jgi:predicted aconitase with swiveling domain
VSELIARPLVPGEGRGRILRLDAPLSFWGGVNPADGTICDPRHPQHGESLCGRVVVMQTCGSSSSSSILLELIYASIAPAAVVLDKPDAILALGASVAHEMGLTAPPVLALDGGDAPWLQSDTEVCIDRQGRISTRCPQS